MKKILVLALMALLAIAPLSQPIAAQNLPGAQGSPFYASRPGGLFYAPGFFWQGKVISGNAAAGVATIIMAGSGSGSGTLALPDGTALPMAVLPLTPTSSLIVDWGQAAAETITPTSISLGTCPAGNIGIGGSSQCAYITATFANSHGASAVVVDGTYGLQTASDYAQSLGGGVVMVDAAWSQMGGTSAMINAAIVEPFTSVQDNRTGVPRYWNPTPTGLALAAPTGVPVTGQAACDAGHQACSDATVAGSASYAGGAIHTCEAYVDIMGNEGPCSADATWTDVSTKAIDLGVPAASAGAVGFVVYISLDAGTYAQAYQIPSTSAMCTLTTLETINPACAVTNTTYNQTGSTFGKNTLFGGGAQVATYPVNTGLHFAKLASTVQTTVSLTPMTNSSVTYSYAPGSRVGVCPGTSSWNATQEIAAGGISASSTTGIPMSMGTWTIPAGCFNYVGAEFRVSGKLVETPGGASDALKVIVAWDAPGTNTTTVPTPLCTIANTHTEAAAQQSGWWSCTVRILTTGATGTALSNGGGEFDIATGAAGVLIGPANDTAVAASGSINLTAPARISVRFSNTGSTVTAGQPLEGTLEFLN